jgi:hypothetical protein
VIYCDNNGALHAAMIIKVRSETVVGLEATEDDGSKIIIRDSPGTTRCVNDQIPGGVASKLEHVRRIGAA